MNHEFDLLLPSLDSSEDKNFFLSVSSSWSFLTGSDPKQWRCNGGSLALYSKTHACSRQCCHRATASLSSESFQSCNYPVMSPCERSFDKKWWSTMGKFVIVFLFWNLADVQWVFTSCVEVKADWCVMLSYSNMHRGTYGWTALIDLNCCGVHRGVWKEQSQILWKLALHPLPFLSLTLSILSPSLCSPSDLLFPFVPGPGVSLGVLMRDTVAGSVSHRLCYLRTTGLALKRD